MNEPEVTEVKNVKSKTTIQVDKNTRDRILKYGNIHGKFGENINDILIKILNSVENAEHTKVDMKTAKLWANGSYRFGDEYAGKTIKYVIEEEEK